MTSKLCKLLAAAIAAASLSGCGSSGFSSAKPEDCPSASVIVPTSSLTTFKQGMQNDPKGELYRVGISGATTDCSLDEDNGITDSSLQISFRATRSEAGPEVTYKVPYYVAVAQGERILNKRDIWVSFTFPENETEATFSDEVGSTQITLENGKKPYDYQIIVGMQLTHDQLEYNKTTSRYGP